MFVNIQLSIIPGDERKFNRRRMTAFIPTCSCGGKSAHRSDSEGTSTMGVGDVSGTGVSVGSGTLVCSGVGVLVGGGVFVGT